VNPLTGEGIYYAVLTGLLAGHAAASSTAASDPASAGRRYREAVGPLLGRHLAHTAAANRLTSFGPVLSAGLTAASRDQAVFDDVVDLGLADGALSSRLVAGLARAAFRPGVALGTRGNFR
jgi:menaquinone-9 beta-reductase